MAEQKFPKLEKKVRFFLCTIFCRACSLTVELLTNNRRVTSSNLVMLIFFFFFMAALFFVLFGRRFLWTGLLSSWSVAYATGLAQLGIWTTVLSLVPFVS